MKFKTTNKTIRSFYPKAYRIGYCAAQSLLRFEEPIAYTAGIYGWNADLYVVDGVALVTGYRPGVGEKINYDILDKYENEARKVRDDRSVSYDTQKEITTKLLHEFIKELAGKEAK